MQAISYPNLDGMEKMEFSYSNKDLSFIGVPDNESEFDLLLSKLWRQKVVDGCFRYELGDLQTKCLSENYHFITQLNVRRANERRRPQEVSDIVMPFDAKNFHFGKVHPKEVLFTINPSDWNNLGNENELDKCRHSLLINVSPLEFGHSLLVPSIEKCNPQVLNFSAVRLAVELMLLSNNSHFRLAYNSLGAYASVNHLHFHAYYLKNNLYLERAPVKKIVGNCYKLTSFPSEGFAFEIKKIEDILPIVEDVMVLVSFLVNKKIAHNVFLTRGNEFNTTLTSVNVFRSLRLFVWARKASYGVKDDLAFNPAVCELAGHIPIKDDKHFKSITEEEITATLYDVCHDTFIYVKKEIETLYDVGL